MEIDVPNPILGFQERLNVAVPWWIEWATLQADRIDPFVSEKPTSLLDRKLEL